MRAIISPSTGMLTARPRLATLHIRVLLAGNDLGDNSSMASGKRGCFVRKIFGKIMKEENYFIKHKISFNSVFKR
jgi:hypothetical protein